MSRSGTILGLSRDQLRDIAIGVGRGFQAYDPNNPLAAAGAALEGSVMSGLSRDQRAEDRSFQLEDEQRKRSQAKEDFTWKAEEESRLESDEREKRRTEMIGSGLTTVDAGQPDMFDKGFANIFGDKVSVVGDDGRATKPKTSPKPRPSNAPEPVLDREFDPDGRMSSSVVGQPKSVAPAREPESPAEWVPKVSQGLISEEGELEDVMSGIQDGDPVGMESFDLGFFGDGTPAVIVKGRGIPVDKGMWMSLAQQRRMMREDILQRTMFQGDVNKAMSDFGKIRAVAPMMQGPLGDSIATLIQMDPKAGTQATQRALIAMETDGGNALHSDVASDIQKRRNEASLGWLTRAKGKVAMENPNGFGEPIMVDKQSVRDEEIERLKKMQGKDADIALVAWQRIEDMVPDPAMRRMNPRGNLGFVQTHLELGRDVVSDMSALSRLEHLASMSGAQWTKTIPRESVPTDPNDVEGKRRYLRYLQEVDAWASNAFGWDLSRGDALAAVVEMRVQAAARMAAASQQTQDQKPPQSNAPVRQRPSI
jgi:hypothetical protein